MISRILLSRLTSCSDSSDGANGSTARMGPGSICLIVSLELFTSTCTELAISSARMPLTKRPSGELRNSRLLVGSIGFEDGVSKSTNASPSPRKPAEESSSTCNLFALSTPSTYMMSSKAFLSRGESSDMTRFATNGNASMIILNCGSPIRAIPSSTPSARMIRAAYGGILKGKSNVICESSPESVWKLMAFAPPPSRAWSSTAPRTGTTRDLSMSGLRKSSLMKSSTTAS
mmetsp:Transcript_2231/g.6655  ORF Transcript_2231/g.6655 Transcript_2231/m.6655 type:complete len:231 (-) Transcript_2231:1268-1960(-)